MRPQHIKQDLLRLSRNKLRAYFRSQIPETKNVDIPTLEEEASAREEPLTPRCQVAMEHAAE
jgi:hypothetical protein